MKKLFKVGDRYFDNKMAAKVYRDSMGGQEKGYYVSKAKDHKRYKK